MENDGQSKYLYFGPEKTSSSDWIPTQQEIVCQSILLSSKTVPIDNPASVSPAAKATEQGKANAIETDPQNKMLNFGHQQ